MNKEIEKILNNVLDNVLDNAKETDPVKNISNELDGIVKKVALLDKNSAEKLNNSIAALKAEDANMYFNLGYEAALKVFYKLLDEVSLTKGN